METADCSDMLARSTYLPNYIPVDDLETHSHYYTKHSRSDVMILINWHEKTKHKYSLLLIIAVETSTAFSISPKCVFLGSFNVPSSAHYYVAPVNTK
jgi:hypothetical protein